MTVFRRLATTSAHLRPSTRAVRFQIPCEKCVTLGGFRGSWLSTLSWKPKTTDGWACHQANQLSALQMKPARCETVSRDERQPAFNPLQDVSALGAAKT